jgi:predicted nucleotidyltransferase
MKYTLDEVKKIISAHTSEMKKFGVQELYIFGSVVRGEATEKSDVDFLVVLSEESSDLFNLIELNQYLEDLLSTKVDLGTKKSLRKIIKDQVLKEAIRVA